jgi:hypothetical protein
MADFQEALGQILNDPEKLKSLAAMAGSLGLGPPVSPAPGDAPAPPPPVPAANTGGSRRYEALLLALEPFLRPERQQKLDRAMKAARLARLAAAGGGIPGELAKIIPKKEEEQK